MLAPPAISKRVASRAASALGVLTLASILTGIALISIVGGTSGRDLAAGSGAALREAVPVLALAETLKLAAGGCFFLVVLSSRSEQSRSRVGELTSGLFGAALIVASGLFGFYAMAAESRHAGGLASALGFASSAATALWVLVFAAAASTRLGRWQLRLGLTFAFASLASLILPSISLLAGVAAVAWWFTLGGALKRSPAQ